MTKLKRSSSSGAKVVGFVITPGEIENRIQALDRNIQALARTIAGNQTPALNRSWREAFDGFTRRWSIERDSYATWDSRLFATRVMPRIEAFQENYKVWASEYQSRTGTAPIIPDARPSEGAFSLLPNEGYLMIAAVMVAVFLLRTK